MQNLSVPTITFQNDPAETAAIVASLIDESTIRVEVRDKNRIPELSRTFEKMGIVHIAYSRAIVASRRKTAVN